ncbi:MAG: putative molybdenum carrier protein [Planctomycetaceae bacterium]|nr:putative molybdenum carrier protein [Planctomycetaceae bacterium]
MPSPQREPNAAARFGKRRGTPVQSALRDRKVSPFRSTASHTGAVDRRTVSHYAAAHDGNGNVWSFPIDVDAVFASAGSRLVDPVLEQIVSGGQTGVDRGALNAALGADFPCGGWCPKGRLAEDGPIPDLYPLVETTTALYAARTRMNVRDSDGTLILTFGSPTGGTALTQRIVRDLKRPLLLLDLKRMPVADGVQPVLRWLARHPIHVMNVAGPRESTTPGIQQRTHTLLTEVLRQLRIQERARDESAYFQTDRSPASQ